MVKQYCIIEADTNDGDYVTKKREIKDEDIAKLKVILKKVKKQGGTISWETLDIASEELVEQHPELTEEECEFLDDYCPSGDNGIHTIESIDILVVQKEISLL